MYKKNSLKILNPCLPAVRYWLKSHTKVCIRFNGSEQPYKNWFSYGHHSTLTWDLSTCSYIEKDDVDATGW